MRVNVTNKGASHKKEYGGANMCKSRKYKKQTGLDKMLVKIADRKGNNLVSARELHKVLQVKDTFTEWIKSQLNTVDAVEDKDYIKLALKPKNKIDGRGRPEIDYVLTIKIAGEIAMVAGIAPNANPETRKASKIVRQYFTDVNELFLQMMLRSNDKAFQKQCMAELRKLIPNYEQKKLESSTIVDFAVANKVVNKVVSEYYGLHYCNKPAMPKEMLETRDKIMDEYIVLYKYCDTTEEIENKLRKAYPKSDTPKVKSNYNRPIKDISTGRLYANAGLASKSTGLPKDKIIKNCNGDIEKVNKEHKFIYND